MRTLLLLSLFILSTSFEAKADYLGACHDSVAENCTEYYSDYPEDKETLESRCNSEGETWVSKCTGKPFCEQTLFYTGLYFNYSKFFNEVGFCNALNGKLID